MSSSVLYFSTTDWVPERPSGAVVSADASQPQGRGCVLVNMKYWAIWTKILITIISGIYCDKVTMKKKTFHHTAITAFSPENPTNTAVK